jgi:hypothetical protein
MASLAVPFLNGIDKHTRLDLVSLQLDKVPEQKLAFVPWANYPYRPEVTFTIAYGTDALFLKYRVREKYIRAVNNQPQSPVYQDSCVEFFIGFDHEPAYYNFEFNCIGANLAGYGADRTGRTMIPVDITRQIRYTTQINNTGNGDLINWQLTLTIPFTAFYHHTITSLQGQYAWANFYKCGDELPEPHFLSWSDIQWPEPNFHLREFFGQLQFTT